MRLVPRQLADHAVTLAARAKPTFATVGKVVSHIDWSKLDAAMTATPLSNEPTLLAFKQDLRDNQPGLSMLIKMAEMRNRSVDTAPQALDSWRVGYEGERIVGELLDSLRPAGYTVLHSVPLGSRGADVDHLLITPRGMVYVINTKHHRGKTVMVDGNLIRVSGREMPYVAKIESDCARVKDRLERLGISRRAVQPLIVFVAPENLKITRRPSMNLVTADTLLQHIWEREQAASMSNSLSAVSLSQLCALDFWGGSTREIIGIMPQLHLAERTTLQTVLGTGLSVIAAVFQAHQAVRHEEQEDDIRSDL